MVYNGRIEVNTVFSKQVAVGESQTKLTQVNSIKIWVLSSKNRSVWYPFYHENNDDVEDTSLAEDNKEHFCAVLECMLCFCC